MKASDGQNKWEILAFIFWRRHRYEASSRRREGSLSIKDDVGVKDEKTV